jgi:HlyD family secretion protein
MMKLNRKTILQVGGVVLIALAVWGVWTLMQPKGLPDGFATGNGRLEAVEIDVSARTPGRIDQILVSEGELVRAGQILVRMDLSVLNAQLAEADARAQQARTSVAAAQSLVAQARSQAASAQAGVVQREAELEAARRRLSRSSDLAREGAASQQETDDDQARVRGAEAALNASRAQAAAAGAAIETAQSQVSAAAASVEAAEAAAARIRADIADSELKAPRDGRIQLRVAQEGEVIGGGGRVLNLVDLTDVYMTFFLPEQAAGRVGLGSEVRLVLDAAPDRPIPATISFVADVAQFTPKTVETESERQKLMFRVRARLDPALLRANLDHVKTGLPGVAYVRLDPSQPWPSDLAVRDIPGQGRPNLGAPNGR